MPEYLAAFACIHTAPAAVAAFPAFDDGVIAFDAEPFDEDAAEEDHPLFCAPETD